MINLGPRVRVTNAIPLTAYLVRLEFEDGTVKEIDLAPFLRGPIFQPLREDEQFFRDIRIEGGTIAWANGADIDPDVLYYDLQPAWMEQSKSA
jgi:hypothetical protein